MPPRANYIRTIMLELERIHNQFLWFGTLGHIGGFDTILMQAWRIREPVMWLCEMISGNRKTYGMNLIGGVRREINAEQSRKILETVGQVETQLDALMQSIREDTSLHLRFRDVGVLPPDTARKLSAVGPTVRGSGVAADSRVDHPYAAYAEVPPKVVTHPEGDVWARTLVRLEEVLESIDVIRRALKKMPEGEIMAEVSEIPPGREAVSYVEAPRGEAMHYLLTGAENRAYRWRVKTPSYANVQVVPVMLKGYSIADAPVIIGSIDPCFSCTHRLQAVDVNTNKVRVYTQQELRAMNSKR